MFCESLVAVKILDRKARPANQTTSEMELERLHNLKTEAMLMSKLRHANGGWVLDMWVGMWVVGTPRVCKNV